MARACLRARLARLSPGRPPAALTMLFGASASRVRAVCEPRAGRVRAVCGPCTAMTMRRSARRRIFRSAQTAECEGGRKRIREPAVRPYQVMDMGGRGGSSVACISWGVARPWEPPRGGTNVLEWGGERGCSVRMVDDPNARPVVVCCAPAARHVRAIRECGVRFACAVFLTEGARTASRGARGMGLRLCPSSSAGGIAAWVGAASFRRSQVGCDRMHFVDPESIPVAVRCGVPLCRGGGVILCESKMCVTRPDTWAVGLGAVDAHRVACLVLPCPGRPIGCQDLNKLC
jgi:hypothetical protein